MSNLKLQSEVDRDRKLTKLFKGVAATALAIGALWAMNPDDMRPKPAVPADTVNNTPTLNIN